MEAGFELAPTDRAEIGLLANPEHPAAVRAVRGVFELGQEENPEGGL